MSIIKGVLARRTAPSNAAAGQPDTVLFINVYRLVRRKAPSSLALYPFENAPYSVAFIEESSTFSISHFAYARDNSGVASQSQATRLAAYTSMRRIAPLDVAAEQPGSLVGI